MVGNKSCYIRRILLSPEDMHLLSLGEGLNLDLRPCIVNMQRVIAFSIVFELFVGHIVPISDQFVNPRINEVL